MGLSYPQMRASERAREKCSLRTQSNALCSLASLNLYFCNTFLSQIVLCHFACKHPCISQKQSLLSYRNWRQSDLEPTRLLKTFCALHFWNFIIIAEHNASWSYIFYAWRNVGSGKSTELHCLVRDNSPIAGVQSLWVFSYGPEGCATVKLMRFDS